MRNLAAGVVLLLGIAASPSARADSPLPKQSLLASDVAASGNQPQVLLKSLDLDLVAKVYAAQCEDEGEICKTNADCCSGLECSGGPQTTCRPQE